MYESFLKKVVISQHKSFLANTVLVEASQLKSVLRRLLSDVTLMAEMQKGTLVIAFHNSSR